MPAAQADSTSQIFGQIEHTLFIFAILIVFVGIPLIWLR